MNEFIPPLKVHLCWFDNPGVDPQCAAIARELFETLHRPLADDVVLRPGLGIPVEFGRNLRDLLAKLEDKTEPQVGVRVVVTLLDRAAFVNDIDRKVMAKAVSRWRDANAEEVFVPVVLHRPWIGDLPIGSQEMLAAVAMDKNAVADPNRRWTLGAEIAVVAGRALLRRLQEKDPPKPRVFISHTKADGKPLTDILVAHLRTKTQLQVWFDETDLPRGEELGRKLDEASSDGVVLVVRTDSYSESPWCARELLTAKEARTPILTLLATSEGEAWTSAYGGNHRTMNWAPGREWEVVTRCAQAWLHGHHFRAHARAALARAGLPADSEVISRRPELLDLIASDAGLVSSVLVHPDPPLSEDELRILRRGRPSARFATPSTLLGRVMLANDPKPPLTGTTIGFSLSTSEDLPHLEEGRVGNGLTQEHVDDALYAIVLATLHSGARIAYGGDFRKAHGYAKKLSDLHRSRRRLGTGSASQLLCFVDDSPTGRGGDAADDVEFEPIRVHAPAGTEGFDELRSVLWHLAMRDRMGELCNARVVLGGKVHASVKAGDGGYTGPWPGFLEEAWRTLEHGRALYLVGGLGGAAGAMASMLEHGTVPPVLTAAHHAETPLDLFTQKLNRARGVLRDQGVEPRLLMFYDSVFADIEQLASNILSRWQEFVGGEPSAWDNALTVEENRRLFRSTDRTEIAHLVFEGLRRLAARSAGKVEIALYHGDIASVPSAAAYAVAVTPGVPPIGASATLDKRLGGRIVNYPWADREEVAVLPVPSGELAGSHVIVLRLPLQRPGETIQATLIEQLAREAARRTDRLGIPSIALVPFATTLGLSVAESAHAIERGFSSAGELHKTLVFCETDRSRYQQVRDAFEKVFELHAGPEVRLAPSSAILHVEVDEPTSTQPLGRIRSTLLVPESAQPIVPLHKAELNWPDWFSLRDRSGDFEVMKKLGVLLWRTALSETMQARLAERIQQPLVVIGDESASGIPWELLMDDGGQSPALAGGLTRRIALGGAVLQPPARASVGAQLRLLLVYNPDGLRSVRSEKEAIEKALSGRADVHVDPLESPTIDEVVSKLRDGYYDVLHYAGHAFFDEKVPASSGLCLAGGVVFTAGHMKGLPSSPRFIFLSACESGRLRRQQEQIAASHDATAAVQERPLAEAFLRHGVEALLGTFYAVNDGAARAFASTVYSELAAGQTLGVSVRTARVERHRDGDPDWANFVLYGNDGLIL
jgi:hypothetical protein